MGKVAGATVAAPSREELDAAETGVHELEAKVKEAEAKHALATNRANLLVAALEASPQKGDGSQDELGSLDDADAEPLSASEQRLIADLERARRGRSSGEAGEYWPEAATWVADAKVETLEGKLAPLVRTAQEAEAAAGRGAERARRGLKEREQSRLEARARHRAATEQQELARAAGAQKRRTAQKDAAEERDLLRRQTEAAEATLANLDAALGDQALAALSDDLARVEGSIEDLPANVASADQFQVLLAGFATRASVVVLVVFLAQIFIGVYRYSLRIAGFYDGRADALELLNITTDAVPTDTPRLTDMARALSPTDVQFGKSPATPVQELVALMRAINNK